MSLSSKRSIEHVYTSDNDEDDEASIFLKSVQSAKLKNLDDQNVAPIDTGMVSPPITPENQRTYNVSGLDQDKVVKKLKFDDVPLTLTPSSSPQKQKEDEFDIINTYSKRQTYYSEAKKLFTRGAIPESKDRYILAGRGKEAKSIKQFIRTSLSKLESNAIYISGPPGTGKTAQVTKLLNSLTKENNNDETKVHKISMNDDNENIKITRRVRVLKINCMTVKRVEDLFDLIYNKITKNDPQQSGLQSKSKSHSQKKRTSSELQDYLISEHEHGTCDLTILLLDEMDNLISLSQQSLFELFTWSTTNVKTKENKLQFPRILLISIANALDLTDRFLPRLRSNNISPQLMQFLPYSAEQIKEVITNKLQTLNESNDSSTSTSTSTSTNIPIFHPAAIQLCAKKSAVNTGDLRKAFDICYKSLELVENDTIKKIGYENLIKLSIDELPKVTMMTVSKVCTESYGSKINSSLKTFNLQHRAILCSLIKFEEYIIHSMQKTIGMDKLTKRKNQMFNTVNAFYDFYLSEIKIDKVIGHLKRNDFLEVLSSLESSSVINLTQSATTSTSSNSSSSMSLKMSKEFGMNRITSSIPRAEVVRIVDDIPILKQILNN